MHQGLWLATMVNTVPTHLEQIVLPRRSQTRSVQQPQRGVWQDNPAPNPARTATPQPASPTKDPRSRQLQTNNPRSQKRTSRKRKTVQVVIWVKPVVKAELQRIAEQESLSVSQTGAAFLETALQQNLHIQHAALLDPIIDKAIRKHMRSYSTRIALLLVRVAFDAGQTRSVVTNILNKLPGVTQGMVQDILTKSSDTAKRNITRKTPQLASIIAEIEQWMKEEGISHE
jgi:hypothetical protein